MAGNLTRAQAQERSRVIAVDSYAVEIDLTTGPDRFGSRTTIRFRCLEPGAGTFAELAGAIVPGMTLNGEPLPESAHDPAASPVSSIRPAADNELVVLAEGSYSHSGQGLHHFVDPVDERVYLHSQFAIADAQQMFACFDQPDLKARFRLTVTAPPGWQVVSNTEPEKVALDRVAQVWHFFETPPLPTYLVALVAGPYHAVSDEYVGPDGRRIPLRLLCRQSLARHLDADEVFAITRTGLDFYQTAFESPYPFEKYDQVFVPEFNLGAMENPGCVTFTEKFVFQSRVTDADRQRRANVILHEMAHMWFGDLVTMRWWDDLWLNESFATYAASLSLTSATHWTGAWATFADWHKTRAYRQDQLPTTHPIVADITDIRSVEVNLDSITYDKGASVLKQLVVLIGLDTFLAGLRRYFTEHAWGSTTLADLLAAVAQESGRDLQSWSAQWLETAGPNTLHPEFEVDAAGRFTSFAVRQTAPAGHPTLRSHRVAIGLYDRAAGPKTDPGTDPGTDPEIDGGTRAPAAGAGGDRGGLVRRHRVELEVSGERTEVPELVGSARSELVLLNDDDLTYAKVRLDPESLTVLLSAIGELRDPLAQAVCWTIAWDLVRDAELPAREYLSLVLAGVGSVSELGIAGGLLDHARAAAQLYVDEAHAGPARDGLAQGLLELTRAADPGSEWQLAGLQEFVRLARSPEQLDVVGEMLHGAAPLAGVTVDTDLRWLLLRALVVAGRAGEAEITAELTRDPGASGLRNAAACRAAIATPEAKAAAWDQVTSGEQSNDMLRALLEGFRDPRQPDLTRPYTERYFGVLAEIADVWPSEMTQIFAKAGYPAGDVTTSTLERSDEYLATGRAPGWLHRLVLEGRDELARALRARTADAARARVESPSSMG
jgi:aminopeptidase N